MVYTPKFEKGLSLLEQLLANRERDELSGINREKMREMAMANQMNQEMLPYAGSMAKAKNKMSLADALRTERLAEHQGLVNQYYVPNIQSEIGARNASAAMARMNTALAPSKHSLAQSRHALDQQKFSPEQLAALSRFRNATSEQREYQNSPQFRAATLKAMERRGMSNTGKLMADEAEQARKLEALQAQVGTMGGQPGSMGQSMPMDQQAGPMGLGEQGIPWARPQEQQAPQEMMPSMPQGMPSETMPQQKTSNNERLALTEASETPPEIKSLLPKGYTSDNLLQGAKIGDEGTYSEAQVTNQTKSQIKKAQEDLNKFKLAVYKNISDPQTRRRALSGALLDYTYKLVPLDSLLYYTGKEGRLRLEQDKFKSLFRGKFSPHLAKYNIYTEGLREWGAENMRAFGGGSVHFKNTERLKKIMGDIDIRKTPDELLLSIEGKRRTFENEAGLERSAMNNPEFFSEKGYVPESIQHNPFKQMLSERETTISKFMEKGLNRNQAERAYQDKLRNL